MSIALFIAGGLMMAFGGGAAALVGYYLSHEAISKLVGTVFLAMAGFGLALVCFGAAFYLAGH